MNRLHLGCAACLLAFLTLLPASRATAESVSLFAAGSLKAAMSEVTAAFQEEYGTEVVSRFGPSGLLRKAIESGERPDLFASANMAHPVTLAGAGWGSPVALFTRNRLCALAQADLEVDSANLHETLMDEKVRLGTSTPKADPSGDYAWELFRRADTIQPGSFDILAGKAHQLTGGPTSEKAPEGRNTYGWVMAEKKADLFLTYCTNAVLAKREVPALKIVQIPENLAVGAEYGLLVRESAPAEAWRLALFILSPAGQQILSGYGFAASALPTGR